MSEYRVDSYFLEKKTIQEAVGSGSQELKDKLVVQSKIISEFSERFSGKALKDAAIELIDGNIEGFPFHYSFSAWALVDLLSESRPDHPYIGYPFVDLYDFVEILEGDDIYPKLKDVFESLNGMNSTFDLPIDIGEWGDMPCITYLETVDDTMAEEARQMKKDIKNEEDWTFDFDNDLEDIEQILDWLLQANKEGKSLCLVLEGDL
ncbi:MAG: hypothetical protein CMH46_10765 [Muricauda sp.]|nr:MULTISPECIES: hypothetical protein [unclassified Allomuricauda]MAU16005.1 hypothetical protein [Allomuricauda sp.]|tara:strand:+ start:1468 stop:2085 length:618 start_codon:yes stop_codon:yes gene_type:complete